MEQYSWILWLLVGIGLIVTEMFTLGFFLLWFGVGALAAALVGLAGGSFLLQFLVFAITSVGLTAMSRTIFARYFQHNDAERHRSGIDALPGMVGTVTGPSKGALNEAAVKVYGSTWTAFPADGETALVKGEKVEVVEVKGASVMVRRISSESPDWRQE